MTGTTPRTLTILRQYGLLAIGGSVAGLGLHFGLVGIDALLVEKPILLRKWGLGAWGLGVGEAGFHAAG